MSEEKETLYCINPNCNKELTGKQKKYCSQECELEYNKEKMKKYQKKYQKENKEKLKEYQKKYQKENKEKLKEYDKEKIKIFQNWKLSLSCKLCPERESFGLKQYNWIIEEGKYIDLHHQDPKKKEFTIHPHKYILTFKKNKESIKEILKTIPLCAFCHMDVTSWEKDDKRHERLKEFTIKRDEIISD